MKTRASDVAVIVPVYNRARTVLDTVERVARQTAPPGRLVVVDDGSTDGTLESLERWRDRDPPAFDVAILRTQHCGAAAARNRGMAAAPEAGFLAFLDSDDLWPDDFLERTRGALAEDASAVAASCDQRMLKLRSGEEKPRSLCGLAENATTWLFTNNAGIASATLFRADPLRRLEGFSEEIPTGHDLALFLRVSLQGPWRHVDGEPVEMVRGSALQLGEQRNLSGSLPDSHRHWVTILETFIEEQGAAKVVPARTVHRVLAHRWHRAGRQLMRGGRIAEARECFRRSCGWRRWNRAWLRRGLTYLQAQA